MPPSTNLVLSMTTVIVSIDFNSTVAVFDNSKYLQNTVDTLPDSLHKIDSVSSLESSISNMNTFTRYCIHRLALDVI